MATRKSTLFYAVLLTFASVVVGMVIASRLDLAPASFARTVNVPSTNSAPLAGPIDATTFRTIAHEASPTVVSIKVTARRRGGPTEMSDLFSFPFGGRRGVPESREGERVEGAGSGFIIDKAGYILTNNHVVEDATAIEVKLQNMKDLAPWLPAKLIGRDKLSDVALIQLTELPKEDLAPAKFGDSAAMQPGDWVMAIGNPFSLSNTVTVGIVSAVERPYPAATGRWEKMIQTDAAINRGNSGGPLLNVRGEVVGINTMIVSDQGSGNIGIGFAVPINNVRDLLPQLQTGRVVRGRIGINVDPRPMDADMASDLGLASPSGALVRSVEVGPARDGGVEAGDVITEFNGKAVADNDALVSMVTRTAPGTSVPLKVMRNKKALSLNVRVAELNLAEEAGTRMTRNAPERPAPKETGFGMSIDPVQPRDQRALQIPGGRGGAIVAEIEQFSPADEGGIAVGDVILSVQGQETRTQEAVSAALDAIAAGRTARIIVWRIVDGAGQSIMVPVRKR
jgi:serine protease Do